MHFGFKTAGESHGKALVAIVEGMPSGASIDISQINHELWRRQQGYGRGGRMKIERDEIEIISGIRHGRSLGSPIAFVVRNRDFANWEDVMSLEESSSEQRNQRVVTRPRPGHADLAGGQKFQTRDLRDILERASARETCARVGCGALAKQLLGEFEIEIASHVVQVGKIPNKLIQADWQAIVGVRDDIELRCIDKEVEKKMVESIDDAKKDGDTLGGVFEIVVKNVPVGLGSHVSWSEKLDGQIAQALMSIPAVKAVEIGEGIENSKLFGSAVHDEIVFDGAFRRIQNRAGGTEGGITNGEELHFRGYMKPLSTLKKSLRSVDIDTKEASPAAFERSDITAVPAAGVIGEAMVAVVLANAMREKFGGDSLTEMAANFGNYQKLVDTF